VCNIKHSTVEIKDMNTNTLKKLAERI